jgi:hypothetical protein
MVDLSHYNWELENDSLLGERSDFGGHHDVVAGQKAAQFVITLCKF